MVPIFRQHMTRNIAEEGKSCMHVWCSTIGEYDSTERQKEDGYDNEQMGSEWGREYGGYKIRSVKARDKITDVKQKMVVKRGIT